MASTWLTSPPVVCATASLSTAVHRGGFGPPAGPNLRALVPTWQEAAFVSFSAPGSIPTVAASRTTRCRRATLALLTTTMSARYLRLPQGLELSIDFSDANASHGRAATWIATEAG